MKGKTPRKSKPGAEDNFAFTALVAHFKNDRDVTQEERKGFGSGALKVRGKIFAMIASKGRFVVKLPRERVSDLVNDGKGRLFEPGPGRIMKEWFETNDGLEASWLDLAKEARAFVASLKG
jgi:hypothetical protein